MRNINLTQSRIKLYFSHFDEKKKNKLYIEIDYVIQYREIKKGGTHKATSNKIFVKIESARESQIVSGYIGLCSSRDTLYFGDVPRARSFDPQRAEVGGRVAPPSLSHRWRKREENAGRKRATRCSDACELHCAERGPVQCTRCILPAERICRISPSIVKCDP